MSEPAWDRLTYWLAESGSASRAEQGADSTIWDEHAFLARWGTAGELEERREQVDELVGWWVLPKIQGASPSDAPDVAAVDGLLVAQARLRELTEAAHEVEQRLRRRGYIWDDSDHTIKALNDGPGPRAWLVAEAVRKVFGHLVERGWDEANTNEIRAEIRDQLVALALLPPDLLTETKIKSAVNDVLNPRRHY